MSQVPPPPRPRALRRSRRDRVVGGVCGGLADYLNMDPTLVRVLAAAVTLLLSGVPVVLYVLALFLVPEEDVAPPPPADLHRDDTVWGPAGPPWESSGPAAPPRAEDPHRP